MDDTASGVKKADVLLFPGEWAYLDRKNKKRDINNKKS